MYSIFGMTSIIIIKLCSNDKRKGNKYFDLFGNYFIYESAYMKTVQILIREKPMRN